jgi:hypothetical protein
MVELYVNNILVDYKRADASGFFTFEIPLIYGTTNVKHNSTVHGEKRNPKKNV